MRVLIIGGGTGGLCLAHGLLQAGIDVQVFERSGSGADGLPGYGIHVNANGSRSLHNWLPEANWKLFDTIAAPAKDIVRFHDEHLKQMNVRDGDFISSESDPIMHRRGVSRLALREVLLDGLTDSHTPIVNWSKTYLRYERGDDGSVTGFFDDGTTATGDVLVGADGSNSRVRQQHLPGVDRFDVGVFNIAGRYTLTKERAAKLPTRSSRARSTTWSRPEPDGCSSPPGTPRRPGRKRSASASTPKTTPPTTSSSGPTRRERTPTPTTSRA